VGPLIRDGLGDPIFEAAGDVNQRHLGVGVWCVRFLDSHYVWCGMKMSVYA